MKAPANIRHHIAAWEMLGVDAQVVSASAQFYFMIKPDRNTRPVAYVRTSMGMLAAPIDPDAVSNIHEKGHLHHMLLDEKLQPLLCQAESIQKDWQDDENKEGIVAPKLGGGDHQGDNQRECHQCEPFRPDFPSTARLARAYVNDGGVQRKSKLLPFRAGAGLKFYTRKVPLTVVAQTIPDIGCQIG